MRRLLFWLAGGTALAVAASGLSYALIHPPPPPVVVAAPGSTSAEYACREWGKATLAMADRLDAAFRKHAAAHRDYKAGKITQEQVFAIWGKTLHDGHLHSGHYQELRRAWKVACLSQPS